MFICPICGAPLERQEHTSRCASGHCYDFAREGYLYLLPPNRKHSKDPGDTKEMVAARRFFLETGAYGAFREELVRLARTYCTQPCPRVLDVGCGEGYYTSALMKALPGARVCGVDIAKCAVRMAAKKYKDASFAVASCFQLPVADESVDLAVNIFAPLVPQELRRFLKPGGFCILAVPGPRHLYGLKKLAYDAPYENDMRETEYEGFTQLCRTQVDRELMLTTNEEIRSLFAMTPYYWKTSPEGAARVNGAAELKTPISFHFLVYQRDETA